MGHLSEMNKKVNLYDVAIIDYGLGNLQSIKNICDRVNLNSVITNDKKIIQLSKSIILPGVGSFPVAVRNLENLNLVDAINHHSSCGKLIWGICLGFQLLFERSNEFDLTPGLSLVKGQIINIDYNSKVSKPHIGWNLCINNSKDQFLELMNNKFYYFNHSYALIESAIQGEVITNYEDVTFVSAFRVKNIIGTQFHPEKSAENGLLLFSEFKKMLEVDR